MSTREEVPESKVRIACIQMEPHVGEKDANVVRSLELIAEAAAGGASLGRHRADLLTL